MNIEKDRLKRGEITWIEINDRKILFIDYAYSGELEKIKLMLEAKRILADRGEKQLLLSNYAHTFVTRPFLNALKIEIVPVLHLIEKQAIIGLNEPKQWILRGFNLVMKTDFRSFPSKEAAIEYLVS